MFKVMDKNTGEVFTVYGLNGMYFLIYNEELDWWFYKDMGECRPYVPQEEQNWIVKGFIHGKESDN